MGPRCTWTPNNDRIAPLTPPIQFLVHRQHQNIPGFASGRNIHKIFNFRSFVEFCNFHWCPSLPHLHWTYAERPAKCGNFQAVLKMFTIFSTPLFYYCFWPVTENVIYSCHVGPSLNLTCISLPIFIHGYQILSSLLLFNFGNFHSFCPFDRAILET